MTGQVYTAFFGSTELGCVISIEINCDIVGKQYDTENKLAL